MKKKLTRNSGLKILSIVLASLLWILIANIADPIGTERIRNVTVDIINDDIVTKSDQVYDVLQGKTIDFVIEGRRSILEEVKASDFIVVADFNLISIFDTIQIEITCPKFGDKISITDGKNQMMKISREESMEENFKVDIVEKGTVAPGHFIGEKTASPNMVSVSGPKARVESVASVIVEIEVYGETDSFSKKAVPKAIDVLGNVIDDLQLELSDDEVDVKIKLLETKTINLLISAIGEPADGYRMTSIEYEPKTIVVAGDNDEFRELKYLSINESITGATENIEKKIDIQEQLPDGVVLVGEVTAVINIVIEKLRVKKLTVLPKDLWIRNKEPGFDIVYINTGAITLSIMGLEEDIKDIEINELRPYIDLEGLGPGTYKVDVGINRILDTVLENDPKADILLTY